MTMVTASKLNEFNQAEAPARLLLERLGWTYVPREALAAERGDEREVLLKGRLRAGRHERPGQASLGGRGNPRVWEWVWE